MTSTELFKRYLALGQLLVDETKLVVFEQNFQPKLMVDLVASTIHGSSWRATLHVQLR
jgi:hypothetical protein